MEFPLERLLSPVRRTHSCDIELNAAIYTSTTTVYYFFSYETIGLISEKFRKTTLD